MAENEDNQAKPASPLLGVEGGPLDVADGRDRKILRRAIREGWIKNTYRLDDYLQKLDKVMADPEDDRVIVSGTAIAVNAQRAYSASYDDLQDAEPANVVNNTQVNIYPSKNGEDLSKLSDDELDARIERARRVAGRAEAPNKD